MKKLLKKLFGINELKKQRKVTYTSTLVAIT